MSFDDLTLRTVKKLSLDQRRFIREGIGDKAGSIFSFYGDNGGSRLPVVREIPFSIIPEHVRSFNPEVYRSHLRREEPPRIEGSSLALGPLELRSYRYDTSSLRSQCSDDGDYGCYGEFSELSILFNDEELFRTDSSCSCHHEGPSVELDPNLGYTGITVFRWDIGAVEHLRKVYRIVQKKEKELERRERRRELERVSGMSIRTIRKLVG